MIKFKNFNDLFFKQNNNDQKNKFFTGDDTKTAVKNSHAGRLDTLIYFFKFMIMQTLQNMHTEHMYRLIKNIEKTNIAYKLNK